MKCILKKQTTLYPMFFASVTMPGLKPLVLCRILSTDPLPCLIPRGKRWIPHKTEEGISIYRQWMGQRNPSLINGLSFSKRLSTIRFVENRISQPSPISILEKHPTGPHVSVSMLCFSWENQFHSRL